MLCVRSLLLVLLCCAQPLSAQSLIVLSEDLKSAWYAPSESSVAVSVDLVRRLSRDGPSGPPPPPPPSPDSPLTKLSATWSTKVADYPNREQHRQALAGMYSLLSQQIQTGSFQTIDQLEEITKQLQTMLLGTDLNRWGVWGRDVGGYLGEHAPSLAAAQELYLEVAAGLDSAGSVGPEFLELLIESALNSEEALSPELRELLMLLIKWLLARWVPGS